MAKKKGGKQAKQSDLVTNIRLGTRVRHIEDNVEGRITRANAASTTAKS